MKMTRRTRKRLALVLSAVVVLALLAVGGQFLRTARLARSLDAALRDGTAAYNAGNYEQAMRHLGFYSARRKEAEAIFMLADARRNVPQENRRHIPAAISFARAALELDPESVRANELLLELYQEAGFATEAATAAEALLNLDPAHRGALEAQAGALARLGRHQEALAAATRLADHYPGETEPRRRVAALMQLSDHSPEEIREYLEQSADLAETDFSFAVLHAEAARATGDAEEALARARRAASLPVTSGDDIARLLRLLDALPTNLHPEAVEVTNSIMQREYSPELAREMALIATERAWKAGRPNLAWQHVQAAVDAEAPLDDVPAAAIGWWTLLQLGAQPDESQLERVDAKLQELRRRPGADAAYWLAIIEGSQAIDEGNLRLAAQKFESAYELGRADLPVFMLGHLDRRTGDWRRAMTRWEPLLLSEPHWTALRSAMVTLLLEHNQLEEAARRAEVAMALTRARPEAVQLCRALAALLESGRLERARISQTVSMLEDIARQVPEDATIQAYAARGFVAADRHQAARNAAQLVLDSNAQLPANLTLALANTMRPVDAAIADQLIARMDTEASGPDAALARARQLLDAGDGAAARRYMEERLAEAPPRQQTSYKLAISMLLAHIDEQESLDYLISLAAEHLTTPDFQVSLLQNERAWQSEETVSAAIGRLRGIAGESGIAWRIHEARRLLTFSPSQSRAAEAIKVLAPALRRDQPEAMALALAGESYLLLDDRNLAIDHLSRAVDVQPHVATFYPRLIELLQSGGRSEEAARRLTAFARIEPLSVEHRRARARLALAQGLWDQAASDLAALPQPGAEDRFGLAMALLRLGQTSRARSILDELTQSPRATPAMLVAAADLHAANGDVEAGRRLLAEAPAELPDALRTTLIAAYLERHKGPEEAAAWLAQTTHDDPDAAAELARYHLERGRIDQAGEILADALAAHPDHQILRRLQALLRIEQGTDLGQSWRELAETLDGWDEAPQPFVDLARTMARYTGRPEDAAAHSARLEQLTRRHPAFLPVWQVLIDHHSTQGDLGRAAAVASAAVQAIPADPRAAHLAMDIHIRAGQLESALGAARQWRDRAAPVTFEADIAIAWLSGELGRPRDGLRALDPWRERLIESRDPQQLTLYARLLIAAGRDTEAAALIWPRAERDRDWALTWVNLASSAEPPTTRQWLQRAESLLSSDASGQLTLGNAWFQLVGRTRDRADAERAVPLLRRAAEDERFRAAAQTMLAATFDAVGDRSEAERYYRLALADGGEDPITLNNLAYLIGQDAAGASEAVELATRAIAAARGQGAPPSMQRAILDTLGVALLSAERYEEAEAAFREALEIEPDAPDLMVGLAEARLGRGDHEDAASLVETIRTRIAATEPLIPSRAARLAALEASLGR